MTEPYARVPRELRRRIARELGDAALSVFLEVFDLCHSGEREFEVSRDRIARDLGRSDSAVERSLKRLRNAGLIYRKRGRNRPNVYGIPDPAKTPSPKAQEPAKTPSPDRAGAGENAGTMPAKTPSPSLYKKKRREEKKRHASASDADRLTAEWMFALVSDLFSRLDRRPPKRPNLDGWANDVRLMRERDDRDDAEIREVFTWANADEFWSANILSPAKLRKQFDRLSLLMQQGKRNAKRTLNTSSAVFDPDSHYAGDL